MTPGDPRALLIGGVLLVIGIVLCLIGFYVIAQDLWPYGENRRSHVLGHFLFFIVPGLVAMWAGAKIGRRRRAPRSSGEASR